MKIIIVGAGISGLATYLELQKHLPKPPAPHAGHNLRIYESHQPRATATPYMPGSMVPVDVEESTTTTATPAVPAPADTTAPAAAVNQYHVVGGGLGIAPNGMRILRGLSADLHARVVAQGYECTHTTWQGANGWRLGLAPFTDKGGPDGEPEECCVATSRHGIWKCLLDEVPEGTVVYRKVVSVGRRSGDGRPVVRFENGEEDEADLIIGADGVWSVVKDGIFGEQAEEYKAKYTGMAGVGNFVDMPLPELVTSTNSMVFTAGGNGFFGYAGGGTGTGVSADARRCLMWWSTYQDSRAESGQGIEVEDVKAQLQQRHAKWADPVIQQIVQKATIDSIYATWVMPPLPTWSDADAQGTVLVLGDAAHALSPTSGQGTSQALEDALSLGLLLQGYLQQAYQNDHHHDSRSDLAPVEREAAQTAAKVFYELRNPRIVEFREAAKKMDGGKKQLPKLAEYGMYAFLWTLMKLPWLAKALLGDVHTRLYRWDTRAQVQRAMAAAG